MSSDNDHAFSYSSFFTKQKKDFLLLMIVFKIDKAVRMARTDNITYSLPSTTKTAIVF